MHRQPVGGRLWLVVIALPLECRPRDCRIAAECAYRRERVAKTRPTRIFRVIDVSEVAGGVAVKQARAAAFHTDWRAVR